MLVVNVQMEKILRVNVLTDQPPRVTDVRTDQTPRARTVRTDQTHLVNVPMAQIDLVDVLIYVMIKVVYFVILILVNV